MSLLNTLARLWRHCQMDEADVRRAIPPDMAERLGRRVSASEMRHTGEVRLCIEARLPSSYLWRHLRGTPLAEIVRQRALMQFAKLRVWDTEDNNGVLIYLLLAEHAIELVADRGLARHADTAVWQEVVAHLGERLRAGALEDGLTQALEEVSAVLVAHFPEPNAGAQTPGPNQLPDAPVLQ